MAKLDIAEKRLPQDGRIKIRYNDSGVAKEIDFRVSVLPTLFGEKIVMRLLDKDKLMLDMTRLGFESESLVKFEEAILRPWGMVLVTGPTGSGKTNTLYSAISKLNSIETNIMTAEDPVEFNLPGINQVQVRESIGLNFAAALRVVSASGPQHHSRRRDSRFRNRRDRGQGGVDRAPGALDAAHQRRPEHHQSAHEHGHRAVPRGELGASDLRAAPRPPHLHQLQGAGPHAASALVHAGFSEEDAGRVTPWKGIGCDRCNLTGYKGRVGLYEVMEVSEELRELILVGASSPELRRKAIDDGMITLRQSGLRKVKGV